MRCGCGAMMSTNACNKEQWCQGCGVLLPRVGVIKQCLIRILMVTSVDAKENTRAHAWRNSMYTSSRPSNDSRTWSCQSSLVRQGFFRTSSAALMARSAVKTSASSSPLASADAAANCWYFLRRTCQRNNSQQLSNQGIFHCNPFMRLTSRCRS